MTDYWNSKDRALLDAILDELIPANPERGIPSAGAFGVADFLGNKIAVDPDLAKAVEALLDRARRLADGVSPDAVRQLEVDMPEAFEALLRLTYMGYYSRPEVRLLVGVAPWAVHPKGYEVPDEPPEIMSELTAPVRARGRIYREI